MATSSPVAIPRPKSRQTHVSDHSESSNSTTPSSDLISPLIGLSVSSYSTTCQGPESCTAKSEIPTSDPKCLLHSSHHDFSSFTPPRLSGSRSSSTISSLSPPSSASLRLTRALSPPREQVIENDPLQIPEESDDEILPSTEMPSSESTQIDTFTTPKKPTRRKSQFKSSLTASLAALKHVLPTPPTIYAPQLHTQSTPTSPITHPPPALSLATSLPNFVPTFETNFEPPISSSVHLQTYSVSLGPPRKPREARLNGDFLRLLALEMEMRRSGKFGHFAPELDANGFPSHGMVVSGKVRMILPKRADREREDVNSSTFNKSRLKW